MVHTKLDICVLGLAALIIVPLSAWIIVDMALFAMSPDMVWHGEELHAFAFVCASMGAIIVTSWAGLIWGYMLSKGA